MVKSKSKQNNENFNVAFIGSPDEDTVLLTTDEKIDSKVKDLMFAALNSYDPSNRQYSAYMLDKTNEDTITPDYIDELAKNINTDIEKVVKANALIKRYIVTDDIIGKTYESLEANVNTEIRLTYQNFSENKRKQKTLDRAKLLVDSFNHQINLPKIIKESIPLTYANGTRILCLRYDGTTYTVDQYPLGVAEISSYDNRGNPIVKINIKELQNRLKKTYTKTRKGTPLFFKNIDEEIQANFPEEVYTAHMAKETEVLLNDTYTGVMRVNNLGLPYGVSPILRALKAALMLENIEHTDWVNNKAKAKKIIHQVMRKETMGAEYSKKGIAETCKAHDDLMQAWKNNTVVYTSIPQVEEVVYVEPKVEDSTPEKVNIYRSKEMTTLGIGFADSNVANFSVANISLDQLMRVVNSISLQLETIIGRWYVVMLQNSGIEAEYAPTIKILDSEQMSFEMKKDLATTLYTIFNGSLATSLEIMGINVEDEKLKREKENDEGYAEIFSCRQTAYTSSGNGKIEDTPAGRTPTSKDAEKQAKDKDYTKKARK